MAETCNILYLNYSIDIGGIETLILDLSRRFNSGNYRSSLCVFEGNGLLQKEFEKSGVPVFVLQKCPGFDITLFFRLYKLIKKEKITLLHTHNQFAWLYGAIAAKVAGIPVVHTQHTTTDYLRVNLSRWRKIDRILAMLSRQITTVANSVARDLVDVEKIDRRKIKVVYNSIDAHQRDMSFDHAAKKKELGISDSEFLIGNVARLTVNKDHGTLIRAFKIVSCQNKTARLLIAGDGIMRDELVAFAKECGLSEKVLFLGPRRDVPEILALLDVFVLSSIREGFPIVVLEAMAAGLPVVVTDVDGNAELVVNEETGIIVKAKDPDALAAAILRLLNNREEAHAMGKKGRQRLLESFTREAMMDQYEGIYRQAFLNEYDEQDSGQSHE